jgi:hypothetical protein
MSRFLKTSAGFVELSEIAGAQAIPTGGPRLHGHSRPRGTVMKLLDGSGGEIGIAGNVDLERLTAQITPASGAVTLAVFLHVEPTDHRPTEVHTDLAAVVAWRITQRGAEPVYLGIEPSGCMFVGVGAGKLLEVATGRLHNGLDEATAAVLAAAQAAWDVDHPDQAPAVVEIEQPKAVAGKRR